MNGSSGKPSSRLAIAEKRPQSQRPGGCVGIFFQFYEWNRRLAKKKSFSKKLLPPVHASRVSKRFSGDEKLPMAKLLLIADENHGGFPNSKKSGVDSIDSEKTHEVGSPGLIAKLMGLESMPAVCREKPKKASFSDFHSDQEKKSAKNLSCRTSRRVGCNQKDLNLERGHMKMESRPQKLQKTGLFERRQVNRIGAETLQYKSVLSRPKKHHQKLATPVKSPRRLSGRNTSRLIEAATKILEPGLQASNRAKCALTYSPSLHVHPKDEVMKEGISATSLDQSKQSSYYASAAKFLKGQSSCKSGGNLLDVVDFKSNVEEQDHGCATIALEFGNAPPQGSGRSKPKPTVYSLEHKRGVVVLQKQDQPVLLAAQAKANMHTRTENIMGTKPFFRGQVQRRVSNHQCKSQKDVPLSTAPKQRARRPNHMLVAKDRTPPRSKLNDVQSRRLVSVSDAITGSKDSVALNRNSSSCTQPRMPLKVLDGRNACDKSDVSSSQLRALVRKRRPMNGSDQVESTYSGSLTFEKQRNIRGNEINAKKMGHNACSVNQNHIKSGLSNGAEDDTASGDKDMDVVSFTFSSPLRHKTGSSSPKEMGDKSRGRDELMSGGTSQPKKLLLNSNNGNLSSQKSMPLKGDSLGALLEQDLRELTYQDADELAMPGRSSAFIFEELISAHRPHTAGRPISQEDAYNSLVGFHGKNSLCDITPDPSDSIAAHCQLFNTSRKLQAGASGVSIGLQLSGDGDRLSPGSVLEAAFSNDSCFSGSLDGGSGQKMLSESMYCFNQPQPFGVDTDLFDSANSFNPGRAGSEIVTNFIDTISRILESTDLADIGLMGNKLNHAKEVILNAEFLFHNPSDSNDMEDFLIGPFLLEKLEILVDALCRSSACCLGSMEAKDQLRRFLFDCMIECLDLKYSNYCKSGFKAWMKIPVHMSREFLMSDFYDEIRRWVELAGKIPDEIIEWEMSHSLGKWTDFEKEAFEIRTEIEEDILQLLIDEMVTDLRRGIPFESHP